MNKKFFVSLAIILFTICSFTFCFATDNGNGLGDAANNVRNFVGGVENTVENAAKDVSNTSKNITGGMENGMNNAGNKVMNAMDNNDGYTSARTATTRSIDNANNTFMGMSSTAWTWLIMGIVAIAIIALVWYYSMQFTNKTHHNND